VSRALRADRGRRERGSSLVEVVLALGLMAGVLGSVAGLFILGAGGVQSGRNTTTALAGARTIIEEVRSWEVQEICGELGLSGTAGSYVVDTRSNSFASKWQPELASKLGHGYATISLASLEPGNPALEDSAQMRVTVTVHWEEGVRNREVRLGTVLM